MGNQRVRAGSIERVPFPVESICRFLELSSYDKTPLSGFADWLQVWSGCFSIWWTTLSIQRQQSLCYVATSSVHFRLSIHLETATAIQKLRGFPRERRYFLARSTTANVRSRHSQPLLLRGRGLKVSICSLPLLQRNFSRIIRACGIFRNSSFQSLSSKSGRFCNVTSRGLNRKISFRYRLIVVTLYKCISMENTTRIIYRYFFANRLCTTLSSSSIFTPVLLFFVKVTLVSSFFLWKCEELE